MISRYYSVLGARLFLITSADRAGVDAFYVAALAISAKDKWQTKNPETVQPQLLSRPRLRSAGAQY